MFDWIYKKRLKDDLETWVAKGWVNSEAAVAILQDQDQDDGRSRLPMALAGIGMVCVALAVFAFIAANWGAIPKSLKLIGIAVLVLGSHGLAALSASKGRKGLADLATGFATLVFVGGMALVGQIFHLPQDWAGGALLVCAGALAAAWLTGSRASLIVAAVAAISWHFTRLDFDESTLVESFIGLAFLIAIYFHAIVYPGRVSRWAAICLLWFSYARWFAESAEFFDASDDMMLAMILAGIGGLASVMVLLDPIADLFVKWSSQLPARSHGRWLMSRSMQDAGLLILCVMIVFSLIVVPEISENLDVSGLLYLPALLPLGLAVLMLLVGFLLSFKTAKSRALFAATALALLSVLLPILTGNILAIAAASLAALIGLCALGTWFNNRFWMLCAYIGLTAVALWLLQVTIGSLLGQSLFFLVAGVLLLVMALWLARLFRSANRSSAAGAKTVEDRT